MKDGEARRCEMFTRVSVFGEMHAEDFASYATVVRLFAELNEIIDRLKDYGAEQISSVNRVRAHTNLKVRLRAKLRKSLAAMSRTARAIAAASGDRGFEAPFILPRNNLNNHRLIVLASTFVERAALHSEEFAKYEMSSQFFEELNNNIELFNKAVGEQNIGRINLTAATGGVKQAIERGRAAVQQLDAIIRNKFRDNPAVMAEWKSASHIERAPKTGGRRTTDDGREGEETANGERRTANGEES